jgi:hypothetical protein
MRAAVGACSTAAPPPTLPSPPLTQWMAACDTIVTKAGPGTIAEALISGLPILLNGNVPCQVGTSARPLKQRVELTCAPKP